jgi:hypothetical protein
MCSDVIITREGGIKEGSSTGSHDPPRCDPKKEGAPFSEKKAKLPQKPPRVVLP